MNLGDVYDRRFFAHECGACFMARSNLRGRKESSARDAPGAFDPPSAMTREEIHPCYCVGMKREGLINSILNYCIALAETSRTRGRAKLWRLLALLRMRAFLFPPTNPGAPPPWPSTRRLVMLLDPLAAWIWPNLRPRTGSHLPQRLARWLEAGPILRRRNIFSWGMGDLGFVNRIDHGIKLSVKFPERHFFHRGKRRARLPRWVNHNSAGGGVPTLLRGHTRIVMENLGTVCTFVCIFHFLKP